MALPGRRGVGERGGRCKTLGASPGGAAAGADLPRNEAQQTPIYIIAIPGRVSSLNASFSWRTLSKQWTRFLLSSTPNRLQGIAGTNFRQISPSVQAHLKKVYLTLCCAVFASAVGAYLHLLWNIGGLLTTLACVGSMAWLLSLSPYKEQKRFSLLMAAGFFEGASIGPLVDLAIDFDPSLLITAFWRLQWPLVVSQLQLCWQGIESICTLVACSVRPVYPSLVAFCIIHLWWIRGDV